MRDDNLIIFRCPYTGIWMSRPRCKSWKTTMRGYEVFACPACTRIHFINVITGAVVSQNRSDTPVDERAHEAEPKAKEK